MAGRFSFSAMIQSRRISKWENIFALVILLAVYLTAIEKIPFGEDESHWIHTSSYLEIFFTEKPTSAYWGEHYWTLTQPPMARYLIGLGRLAGGYRSEELNTPWQFDHDWNWNVDNGNLPESGLLWWSRLPMALLAALSGWLIYLLLRKAAGRLAGAFFLLIFVCNPYFLTHLRRAMSETPLLFFTVLAMSAGFHALQILNLTINEGNVSLKALQKSSAWFILAGACCGLAGASKINGLFSTAGLVLLIVTAGLCLPGFIPADARRIFVIRTAVLSIFAALAVFVALNPYLYPNPLVNTARMFKFRMQEMAIQVAGFPENVINGTAERINVISRRLFEDYAWPGFHGALFLNLFLGASGLANLLLKIRQCRKNMENCFAAAVLLLIPAPLVASTLVTPLDWNRYYLFAVLLVCWCISAGTAMIAGWIPGRVRRLFNN